MATINYCTWLVNEWKTFSRRSDCMILDNQTLFDHNEHKLYGILKKHPQTSLSHTWIGYGSTVLRKRTFIAKTMVLWSLERQSKLITVMNLLSISLSHRAPAWPEHKPARREGNRDTFSVEQTSVETLGSTEKTFLRATQQYSSQIKNPLFIIMPTFSAAVTKPDPETDRWAAGFWVLYPNTWRMSRWLLKPIIAEIGTDTCIIIKLHFQ